MGYISEAKDIKQKRLSLLNSIIIKNNMKHYVLVGWPEIQDFMVHERWNECVFCIEIENHPVGDSTYAVPFDLYEEVCQIPSTKQTNEEALEEGLKQALKLI